MTTSTVYQAVAAGEIPHVRVNNAIRIAVASIDTRPRDETGDLSALPYTDDRSGGAGR